MGTDSYTVAIGQRLKRAFNYILSKVPDLLSSFAKDLGQMLIDLVKSIVASFFKKALHVIKEGFGIIMQALKILTAPSEKMTFAEKGDAILKVVASLLPALLVDIGLTALLQPYFTWWPPGADIAAGVISALTAALLGFVLDRLDLFSVKGERRLTRVREIFDARISAIQMATRNFEVGAHETMKTQRVQFEKLKDGLSTALAQKDFENMNKTLDGIASFFHVNIPYSSSEEFVQFIRKHETIIIGA